MRRTIHLHLFGIGACSMFLTGISFCFFLYLYAKGKVSLVTSLLFSIALSLLLIFLVAKYLASRLTQSIVQPIEQMASHLDEISENVPYPELSHFALAIREQQEKRSQNEQMRQEFTANVSHELKTPLTSISGYAEMIENGMVREEDLTEFAGKIHHEAGRLLSLIGDIIQLAELDEPSSKREFYPVNLLEISQRTVALLTLPAERSQIHLSVIGSPCFISGNAGMLEELIYNLCDNAIRYNRPGGSVIVSVQETDQGILLKVEDTGIGIPKEHQSRIFERFYRVDKSRSKETGGTGLGLAIVKHIALQHHAKITVSSEVHHGTQIYVCFPPLSQQQK